MKSINIDVSPEGEVTITAVGYKGKACDLATKALEDALGQVKSKKKLPEYYQQQVGQQKVGGS